ncbi:MAG TPA: aminomethyl-transferring glycine dehydrogenase subunit GcvPA [Candidatus Limnocylindrales bacterium]|nr:aminomethyl-transferring glycine dehydrogenase subunit GcvPA [Candidatus Limnocylindrales bacterium]
MNNPYSPHTDADREAMLARIGVGSIEDLFAAIPKDARAPKLGIGRGMSEQEVQSHLESLAAMNKTAGSGPFFIGGPIQRRYIPAAVPVLALRGEFLTAYTPYQPEVSQGTLQAVFEYQSLMAELLAMDVVNSSMYDGGSATAEAALMAVRLTGRKKVVVSSDVDFTYRRTLRTYARGADLEIVEDSTLKIASLAADAACLIVQHPDAFGTLVDVRAIADAAHGAGALCIQVTEPHANALLEPPGALGADIVVGEGQPLGIPMSYGGPHLGIFACREALVRQMPGRIAGQTVDADGVRGFVNTLQTREQHIRREKATSNICTNEALAAIHAATYLALLGPEGLRAAARAGVSRAHTLAKRLAAIPGCSIANDGAFFDRFTLRTEIGGWDLRLALLERGIQVEATASHYVDGKRLGRDDVIVQCTEMTSDGDADALVDAVAEIVSARRPVAAR